MLQWTSETKIETDTRKNPYSKFLFETEKWLNMQNPILLYFNRLSRAALFLDIFIILVFNDAYRVCLRVIKEFYPYRLRLVVYREQCILITTDHLNKQSSLNLCYFGIQCVCACVDSKHNVTNHHWLLSIWMFTKQRIERGTNYLARYACLCHVHDVNYPIDCLCAWATTQWCLWFSPFVCSVSVLCVRTIFLSFNSCYYIVFRFANNFKCINFFFYCSVLHST